MQEIRLETQKTRRTNSTMKGNGDAMIIQNHKRNIKKYIYKENPESKKEYQRKKRQGKKKVFNKAEKFHQQIRQGPYYICTVCHHCLYQHSARLFHDQKYVLN